MDQCIIVSRNHIKCVSQKPTTKKNNCNMQNVRPWDMEKFVMLLSELVKKPIGH